MIRLEGEEVKRAKTFKYMGSTPSMMENLTQKPTIEFRAVGGTGRKCMECCDRRMKVKIKMIVRPAMVHGADTWAVKNAHEKKMEVAEMCDGCAVSLG